ncbi:MAG: DapH/DapD/GlmU-related protein [Candidatus Tyrphobacter sp.]
MLGMMERSPVAHLATIARAARNALRIALADEEQRALLPHVTFAGGVVLRGADRMTAGRGVFIDHRAYLSCSTVNEGRGFIHLGNDVEIGPYSVLWGGGGITIGNNVHLGAHVHITSQQGRPPLPGEHGALVIDVAPVTIGDDVLVYSGAIIVPGVRIGANAVIAAGAVVVCDVPAGTLVAGVPARARDLVYG